jgi:hypothetical protein
MGTASKSGGASGGVSKRPRKSQRGRSRTPANADTVPDNLPGRGNEADGLVFSDPVFVPPATYDPVLGVDTFRSVDYEGSRYSVGDHVALFAGPGKEWVCIIEQLYASPEDGKPSFKGRWYWTMADVEEHRNGRGEKARSSKNAKYELISSDNRDSNLIEVINRKCIILSWKNFRDLLKRNRKACDGIYFCDRMYYHKAFKFQELTPLTFPGDPLPVHLLSAPNDAPASDSVIEQDIDAPELRSGHDDDCDPSEAFHDPAILKNAEATGGSSRPSQPGVDESHPSTHASNCISSYYLF